MKVVAQSDVEPGAFWADFDALLPADDTLVDPGPEWQKLTDFNAHLQQQRHVGNTTARRLIVQLVDAGLLEIRLARMPGASRGRQQVCRVVK